MNSNQHRVSRAPSVAGGSVSQCSTSGWSVQDRTLLWVNLMLGFLEDLPMVSLTFSYALRLQDVQQATSKQSCVKTFWIVSMMMSAGAIYLKCGGLIYYPLLSDQKEALQKQIAHKAVKLSAEERHTLEQHGVQIAQSKAKPQAKPQANKSPEGEIVV